MGGKSLLQPFLALQQSHHHSSQAWKHMLFVKQEGTEDSIQTQTPTCIWVKPSTFAAKAFPLGWRAVFLDKASSACLTDIWNALRFLKPVLPFLCDEELGNAWTGIFTGTSRFCTLNSFSQIKISADDNWLTAISTTSLLLPQSCPALLGKLQGSVNMDILPL